MALATSINFKVGLGLCLFAGLAVGHAAQTPPSAKPAVRTEAVSPRPVPTPPRTPTRVSVGERATTERTLDVDPNVNLKFCVSEGELKINGWERDEIRVFVRDGRNVGMKVLERSAESDKPNWVWIMSSVDPVRAGVRTSECLAGESVEIDVPVNASVSMEARTSGATIDTVKSVSVKVIEGSISIRNVPGGVKAETFQGDVMLENSRGEISLQATTGNIIAYDIKPGQIADVLRAKTNSGTITMQNVSHRQIDANSISGSVVFNGSFLPGGIYKFKTSNGSVRMQLPAGTSCTIAASYGFGSFNSALPVEVMEEQITPGGKSVVAKMGNGEATVNVTTSSGSIAIRAQEP